MLWRCLAALFLCALTAGVAAAQSREEPQPVPRLTERTLDKATYVALAKQWREYIAKNGESADALVNLGMAHDYSQEPEAALVAARRAVELEPTNPMALAFLGKMLAAYKGDEEAALEVLRRCRAVAPDYGHGLTLLAATYLRRGEFFESEDVFKTIFAQRTISRPLQDYAYNMLVGLPKGAVLITAGDNDTFPVLALQSGMEFRRDVIVLNRSLLNLPGYAEAQFERHPSIRPDYNISAHEVKTVDGRLTLLSHALVARLIEERKAPVYLTVSAAVEEYGYKPEAYLEGMNMRAAKKGLSAEESAQLFLATYRLDSATDWTVPWSLAPNEAKLISNYAAAMIKLAEDKSVDRDTRARLLDRAAAIAEFHSLDAMSAHIRSLREK